MGGQHEPGLGLHGCACSAQPEWVAHPVNSLNVLSTYLPGTLAIFAVPPSHYPDERVLLLCRAGLCLIQVQQIQRVRGGIQVSTVFGGILAAVGGLGRRPPPPPRQSEFPTGIRLWKKNRWPGASAKWNPHTVH